MASAPDNAHPAFAPNGGAAFVPWGVYLDDRRRDDARLDRMESKIDKLLERQERLELAAAHDDGQEVAEAAAAEAVVQSRRSKRELARDIGLTVFSAALAVGGTVLTYVLTGGSS